MTAEERRKKRKHEEDLRRIREFRLMDDEFMTACFDGSPESVELILQIIMEKPDLTVVDVKVQYFIKNLRKRSVWLDVFATDSKGKKYNIEIQRADTGAGAKRARYNSSLIDSKVMEKGKKFEDLSESYVVFITEKDVLGKGEPLYHIDRYVAETGEPFGDDAHIIYVNGTYRGDTPLGHLMEDFNCTEPEKMYYNELKNRVKYFKETKEGVATMCKALEEMREKERIEGRREGILEGRQKSIEQLMKNLSVDFTEACRILGLTPEEYKKVKAMR